MSDILPPAVVAFVLLLAGYVAFRLTSLGRGMKAYTEAQALLVRPDLSVQERARLRTLRRRARSKWGPPMDPGLPPMERLSLIDRRDQWIVQKINGTENPEHLKLFVEIVLWFLQKHGRSYSYQQFEDKVAVQFARQVAGSEYRRLIADHVDDGTASQRARDLAARVTKRFLSSGDKPDGTWRMIEPRTNVRAAPPEQ